MRTFHKIKKIGIAQTGSTDLCPKLDKKLSSSDDCCQRSKKIQCASTTAKSKPTTMATGNNLLQNSNIKKNGLQHSAEIWLETNFVSLIAF